MGDVLWVTESIPADLPDLPEGWKLVWADPPHALQLNTQPDLMIVDLPQSPVVAELAAHFSCSIRVLAVPDCQDERLLPYLQHYHVFCLQPLPDENWSRFLSIAKALRELHFSAADYAQLLACTHLPMIPPLAQQLQQLLLDPDVRIDKLAELIEQDAVLSARLLQLANSAYMGFNQETHSIQMAINRLGLNLLYGVVLALSVDENTSKSDSQAGIRLVGHCRQVGQWLGLEQAAIEQMVLAALFHQLGHTLLLSASSEMKPLTAAQAGAFMLTLWGFSPAVASLLVAQQSLAQCLRNRPALGLYMALRRQPLRVPETDFAQVLLKLGLRQHWPAE